MEIDEELYVLKMMLAPSFYSNNRTASAPILLWPFDRSFCINLGFKKTIFSSFSPIIFLFLSFLRPPKHYQFATSDFFNKIKAVQNVKPLNRKSYSIKISMCLSHSFSPCSDSVSKELLMYFNLMKIDGMWVSRG